MNISDVNQPMIVSIPRVNFNFLNTKQIEVRSLCFVVLFSLPNFFVNLIELKLLLKVLFHLFSNIFFSYSFETDQCLLD